MDGMIVVCGCGQSFIATAGEACCSGCEAVRDPLTCAACGTRMLEPVASGVCGFCGPWHAPVYAAAVAALRAEAA